MTLTDFAKLVGLSRPYVYMLEVNKNTNGGKPIVPSAATIMKVAKVLNVPVTEFLNEEELTPAGAPVHDPQEEQILQTYRKLDKANRKMATHLLSALWTQQQVAHA